MTIALTDIPDAVADYLNTQVTTAVSPVTAKGPKQDVLTPSRDGVFTVTATNGDATKGVRLLDVIYHLKVADESVLKFIAPSSAIVVAFEDAKATTVIAGGTVVSEMFVRLEIETTLDAGQVGTALHLDAHCIDQGQTSITAHVHADVDQNQLFPT